MTRSPLLALLHREWRNARTMTAVFVLLAPLAAWGTVAYLGASIGFCDVAPVVYGLALASDSVAAEKDARLQALALLPSGLLRVWFAKACFLLAMTTAYSAWCHGVAAAAALLPDARHAPDSVLYHLGTEAGQVHVIVLTATVICLFFSSVVARGIAALFLTACTAGAVYGSVRVLEQVCGIPWAHEGRDLVWPWLVGLAAFGAGSALAVARGRLHLGAVGRPWLLGGLAPMCVVVIPVVALGLESLRFRASDVTWAEGWHSAEVSPDGRWLLAHTYRSHPVLPLPGQETQSVIDIATGRSRRLPQLDPRTDFGATKGWCAKGTIWAAAHREGKVTTLLESDPDAAEFTWIELPPERFQPAAFPAIHRLWVRDNFPVREVDQESIGFMEYEGRRASGETHHGKLSIHRSRLSYDRDGSVGTATLEYAGNRFQSVGLEVVYWKRDGLTLAALDLDTGSERVLHTSMKLGYRSPPDLHEDGFLLLWDDGGLHVLDLASGRRVVPPIRDETARQSVRTTQSPGYVALWTRDDDEHTCTDLLTGEVVHFRPGWRPLAILEDRRHVAAHEPKTVVSVFGDAGKLKRQYLRDEVPTISVFDATGRLERQLLPPVEEVVE